MVGDSFRIFNTCNFMVEIGAERDRTGDQNGKRGKETRGKKHSPHILHIK